MTDHDIELVGREWKVSVTEKRSTGDYENVQPHASLEGTIPDGSGPLDEDARKAVKARLLSVAKELTEVVERTADNRVALPEGEDWGVHNGNGGEDD